MQVALENLSGLERKLNIVIPSERIENESQKKLHKFKLTAEIPGFRPGKVPFPMLQKRYGESARADAIDNIIRETLVAAIKQEKLDPIGTPKVEIISVKAKEPFSYSATFEVFPEIDVAKFSQLEVERVTSKLTDSDVSEMLEKLRKQHSQWEEITDSARKSQAGDKLVVDFEFKILDNSPDASNEVNAEKDVEFILGDGSMWADFEKNLYGVGVGEKKKYTLLFPQTHTDKKMIGKNAEFEVEVKEIYEPILSPLDDEFAKKFSIKDGGLKKLKANIREKMESDLKENIKNLFKNSVINKLLDNNLIEIPKILLEEEINRLFEHFRKYFAAYKKEDCIQHARRNVSLGVLLYALVKSGDIQAKPQESCEERVIEYIASKINVVEKEVSYKEIILEKAA